MPETKEENALTVRETSTNELQTASQTALAQQEIQAAIIVAKRCPRDEDQSYAAILNSCKRFSFAENATYRFPRGGSEVSGPSIYFAREFARVWGNFRHGAYVIHDDDKSRTIRCWAWDVQTNSKVEVDDTFAKLIFRKKGGWITPDERDLRELTNRRAAIGKRNCILELLPDDMIEDALDQCEETVNKKCLEDPDAARKATVKAFAAINVPIEQLGVYLGHALAQSSPAEIANLRKIWKSIKDGNSTWAEYMAEKSADAAKKAEDKLRGTNGTVLQEIAEAERKSKENPPTPEQREQLTRLASSPPRPEEEQASLAETLSRSVEAQEAANQIGENIDQASDARALELAGKDIMRLRGEFGEEWAAPLLAKYQAKYKGLRPQRTRAADL